MLDRRQNPVDPAEQSERDAAPVDRVVAEQIGRVEFGGALGQAELRAPVDHAGAEERGHADRGMAAGEERVCECAAGARLRVRGVG